MSKVRENLTVTRYRGFVNRAAINDRAAGSPLVKTAVLKCHHEVEYGSPLPNRGDMVYCNKCRDYSVVLLLQASYKVKCRDCKYSRSFARAHFAADSAGNKHCRFKGHTVELLDGSNVIHTFTPSGGTIEIPLPAGDDDPPPF